MFLLIGPGAVKRKSREANRCLLTRDLGCSGFEQEAVKVVSISFHELS